MNGQLEEHLKTIDDFIEIDDKIVTYKWISKVLKVHTNTAKQLLFAFTKKPGVRDKLLVTYLVAGEQIDGEGLCFRLVQEKDLEDTKQKFNKIISVHVYSIQNGGSVTGADIYNADCSYKLTCEDGKFRSIQPEEKIGRREIKVVQPKQQETASVSKKPPASKGIEDNPKPQLSKEASPKKNGKVTEDKPQPPKNPSPKKNDKKNTAEKSGNIEALFSKQASKKKVESTPKAVKETKENDIKPEEKSKGDEEIKTPTVNKSAAKNKRKKPNRTKDSAAKRRKRIQIASDSESSGEEESDGNERFPSPEPEPVAPMVIESEEEDIIPSTPIEKGKKRVRKQVDRMYEDEEGYVVTKKEFVIEECTDDEEENHQEEKVAKVEPVAEVAKQNGNSSDNKAKSKADSPHSKPSSTAKSGNKPGKPSKAKANEANSNKKQNPITNYFTRK